MVSNIFYFHPYLGNISNLTNIFQRGWNHQLDFVRLIYFGIRKSNVWKIKNDDLQGVYPKTHSAWPAFTMSPAEFREKNGEHLRPNDAPMCSSGFCNCGYCQIQNRRQKLTASEEGVRASPLASCFAAICNAVAKTAAAVADSPATMVRRVSN